MQFEFNVHIDGEGFDPQQFNESIDPAARGVVRTIRPGNAETATQPVTYWQSKTVSVVSGSRNEPVREILNFLRPKLQELKKLPDVRILASVGGYFDDAESLSGFFFPAEIIELLATVGADLDVDIVPSAEVIKTAVPQE